MRLKGIAGYVVDALVRRTVELGQGRGAGCIGFIDQEGRVTRMTPLVDGGLGGIPLRRLLNGVVDMTGHSLLEGLRRVPPEAVMISTRPGKTGLNTDITGVDFFNIPMITIGVKGDQPAGIGVVYPKAKFYDMATREEELNLSILKARTMEEERDILEETNKIALRYLEVSQELDQIDMPVEPPVEQSAFGDGWSLPRFEVNGLNRHMAELLIEQSMKVSQGREVAALGMCTDDGIVQEQGKVVVGGIGFVPSRLLASSAVDITGKSLYQVYSELVDPRAVIVHTHPGGTGVMHMGDANAGPSTWGRPIIAIGHDQQGNIRGATVIQHNDQLFTLADEDEELSQKFFEAGTPQAETEIRNRKFGIAQEYTNLCLPIELI